MAVTAPSQDAAGAKIDAQIAALQALVNANANPRAQARLQQELNRWQVLAVDHYMVTGWLNAAAVLAVYPAPSWDTRGQNLTARVAYLQALYNNAPTMPTGNADGYGGDGWTTIASNYLQQLYAAQISLVEHIMDFPGGTLAATMLANLTGSQTSPAGIPFVYVSSMDAPDTEE